MRDGEGEPPHRNKVTDRDRLESNSETVYHTAHKHVNVTEIVLLVVLKKGYSSVTDWEGDHHTGIR